jgi:HlyD family secretion protein
LQDGRLAKRRVELGERLIDGRVRITSELAGTPVVDDRPELREGRAARAAGLGL